MKKKKVDKSKGLFGKARYKKYADIISFKDVSSAEKSRDKLLREFYNAETRAKEVRIVRVSTYASNRARASSKRRRLSKKERNELIEIADIYANLAQSLGRTLRPRKNRKK